MTFGCVPRAIGHFSIRKQFPKNMGNEVRRDSVTESNRYFSVLILGLQSWSCQTGFYVENSITRMVFS